MDKIKVRDYIRLIFSLIFSPIYIPHIIVYKCWGKGSVKKIVDSDIKAIKTDSLKLHGLISFLYLIHNNRWFRRLFYYRSGPIAGMLISWIRSGDKSFTISYQTTIGPGINIAHPYSTILNAESIGSNFSCIQCTTIGKTPKGRPKIGDNVCLGAGVMIVGPVKIGNNVTIGAGAVVVKDIPDNSVVVGNPAKVIKRTICPT